MGIASERIKDSNISLNTKKPLSLKRKVLAMLGGLFIAAHTLPQAANLVNDHYHSKHPSSVRSQFKTIVGSELKGWSRDIEEQSREIFELGESLYYLKKQHPELNINSVRIIPANYIKKTFNQQWAHNHAVGAMADTSKASIHIAVGKNSSTYALEHEAAHIFFDNNLKGKKKDIEGRLVALSQDPSGRSLYFSFWENILNNFKNHRSVNQQDVEDFLRSGVSNPDKLPFINRYSRSSSEEEFCELFALPSKSFINYPTSDVLTLLTTDGSRLAAKFKVMEENGAIPRDFRAFLRLLASQPNLDKLAEDPSKGEKFLSESSRFLDEYFSSRYANWVYFLRGRVIGTQKAGKLEYSTFVPDKQIEFMQGLRTYDDSTLHTLRALQKANSKHDTYFARAASKLIEEYVERVKKGDLTLLLEKPSNRLEMSISDSRARK